MSFKPNHFVKVSLRDGREVVTIHATDSLNTWTRKDGGFTVRVDNTYTRRFSRFDAPRVLKRSKP